MIRKGNKERAKECDICGELHRTRGDICSDCREGGYVASLTDMWQRSVDRDRVIRKCQRLGLDDGPVIDAMRQRILEGEA